MRLSDWFQREGKGATTRLSKRANLTFAAVARIRKGKAVPDAKTAFAIEAATDGEVTVREILEEALAAKSEPEVAA